MTLSYAIILAMLQGITEFLPVSSSGHLVVAQHIMDFSEPPFVYDLLLHLSTMIVVVIYFFPRIKILFTRLKTEWKQILLPLIFVTLPVVALGLFAADFIESSFSKIGYVAVTYLFTAALLFSTLLLHKKDLKGEWLGLDWVKSLVVGVFQAAATVPGVSRSGSTIVGGMHAGLKPKEAFEFSFFAGLISVTGASVVSILKSDGLCKIGLEEIVGFVVCGVVGYFVLKILDKVLKSGRFWYFGYYCLLMSAISFFLWLR